MAGAVICDAGPLIALAGAGHLHLLERLFGIIWLPPAVRTECLAGGDVDRDHIAAALEAGWLQVRAPTMDNTFLSPSLGPGEVEAIRLAAEHPGSLLIVDDRLARRYAVARDLAIVGTVRLLWIGEQRGEIEDAERVVRQMAERGYRVSTELLERIRFR